MLIINHITKGVIMKKQFLFTLLVSCQALPAFQKDFFNALRDFVDAAEERFNKQHIFSYNVFKEQKDSSTVTLSSDETGVTARISNAPYDDTASTRTDKHMLILKHPAFTAAFKEGIIRRRNDNVYELAARISTNKTEEVQDEQRTAHSSFSSFMEKNIILPKPVDTSKATITYFAPAETQEDDQQNVTKGLGEYVFHFPYKEIQQQQVPIIVKQTQAQPAQAQ